MKKNRGFTIIELVIAIAVVGVISCVMVPLIRVSFDTWYYISDRKEAVYNGYVALQRIAQDLRQIRNASSLLLISATRCQLITTSGETVNIQLSSTSIVRNTYVLAEGVQDGSGLAFTYLDSSGNSTLNISLVRSIIVTITIVSSNQTFSIKTQISPRNLQ